MTIDRRGLLGGIGAGAAVVSGPALASPARGQAATVAFLHGVASGDPDSRSAVFWTRVTPGDASGADIEVTLQVARDAAFTDVVRTSSGLRARASRDFTVKHDLDGQGLEPGVEYHYRFIAGDVISPVGRVRTLPEGATLDVVLGVVSCSLYPGGLFNAYDALSKEGRLDAVIHLGDYIYEYGAEPDDYGIATGARLSRIPQPPHEIVTLDDYRLRHAQYKSDPDLQAAHARAAFICVWDDHEVANDTWATGAENHQPDTEGAFSDRKAAALRAYFEWMPIREPKAGLTADAIYRSFDFGDLATLAMVETRLLARQKQLDYATDMPIVEGRPDLAGFNAVLNAPDRDLLGDPQRDWIQRTLAASKAAGRPWQVIGNQVVMARVAGPDVTKIVSPAQIDAMVSGLPAERQSGLRQMIQLFALGVPFGLDSWDGYPAGRERLYQAFKTAGVQPIVLAGDSHAFWVNELKDAAGERRAVEFGTSSVTSPSPGDAVAPLPLGPLLSANNDEVVFCDQTAKGYILLTLTPQRAQASLQTVSTITAKPYTASTLSTWTVHREADGISSPVRLNLPSPIA